MTSSSLAALESIQVYSPNPDYNHLFRANEPYSGPRGGSLLLSWLVNTCRQLDNLGCHLRIVNVMPDSGIVLFDAQTLVNQFPFTPGPMLVCIKGDWEFHPSAHMHIVQNMQEANKYSRSIWNPLYVPHWPQPGLVPRDPARGSQVQNIGFMGKPYNLIPDFKTTEWLTALDNLSCNWLPVFEPTMWADYSIIDVVVAVRGKTSMPWSAKPASKLVNAWHAGVPAILTPEPAFMEQRRSELDFMIATDMSEAADAVTYLVNNPQAYQLMVQNGFQRAREFSTERITSHWVNTLQTVVDHYGVYSLQPRAKKRIDFLHRFARLKISRQQKKLAHIFS